MLKNIKEQPLTDDTWDMYLDHVVIAQLSEFRERRAIDDLKRVAAFDLEGEILELPHVREMQSKTIRLAQEALDNILKPDL
jgi:hypothetical protein